MGIDMQGFNRPEGSDDLPPGVVPGTSPKPTSPPPRKAPTPQASTSKPPPPEPAKVEEDVEMEEAEDDEEVKTRKEAEAEKRLGAEAYKKRDFEAAITHFSKAWDVWPKDLTFLTNLGGRRIYLGTLRAVLTVGFHSRLLRTRQLRKVHRDLREGSRRRP